MTIFNIPPTKSTKSCSIFYYTFFTINCITFFPSTHIYKIKKNFFNQNLIIEYISQLLKHFTPNLLIHNILEKKLYGGGGRLPLPLRFLKHFSTGKQDEFCPIVYIMLNRKLYHMRQIGVSLFFKFQYFFAADFLKAKGINKKSPFLRRLLFRVIRNRLRIWTAAILCRIELFLISWVYHFICLRFVYSFVIRLSFFYSFLQYLLEILSHCA